MEDTEKTKHIKEEPLGYDDHFEAIYLNVCKTSCERDDFRNNSSEDDESIQNKRLKIKLEENSPNGEAFPEEKWLIKQEQLHEELIIEEKDDIQIKEENTFDNETMEEENLIVKQKKLNGELKIAEVDAMQIKKEDTSDIETMQEEKWLIKQEQLHEELIIEEKDEIQIKEENTSDNETKSLQLLPEKSKERYECCFTKFLEWRRKKGLKSSYSENVLMAYFGEISEIFKPNTLWSIYSMLRTTINVKRNIDISKYAKLNAFLKRKSHGCRLKKSKTLTTNEINQFLQDAPDEKYLFTKVALVVGVSGAFRKKEMCQLTINDIEDLGTAAIIKIIDSKNKRMRTFTLTGRFYKIFKKYADLRPTNLENQRFFINYQNQRCTRQVVGVNKFGRIPKEVATYLKLPNPNLYTGHSFRRSSAIILVDAGDVTALKHHGGWKSSTVAESYIGESINNNMQRANKL